MPHHGTKCILASFVLDFLRSLLLLSGLTLASSSSSSALWRHRGGGDGCFHSFSLDGGLTVRCSGLGLTQISMPQLDLDPSSLAEVICLTSDLPDLGAVGVPLVLLAEDWDLCISLRRTTDVAMLVTMFLWFSMVISFLLYYVRANQEDTQRHMDYLKSLPTGHV